MKMNQFAEAHSVLFLFGSGAFHFEVVWFGTQELK